MTKEVLKTAFDALLRDILPPDSPSPGLTLADEMASGGLAASAKEPQIRSIFDSLGTARAKDQNHLLPLKEMSPEKSSDAAASLHRSMILYSAVLSE